MTDKYYTIGKLVEALKEAGIANSVFWIYYQEEKGNLVLPRSTTNFKKAQGGRKLGAVRMVNKKQIEAIIKAFSPGGKGYWKK